MNTLKIRKLGILSVAKIYGLMLLVMSLLISIPYGLFIMVFGAALMGSGEKAGLAAGGGGVVIGLIVMIALPIFYGVIGFIAGAISALVYNLFAGMVGGIEIEVETIQ